MRKKMALKGKLFTQKLLWSPALRQGQAAGIACQVRQERRRQGGFQTAIIFATFFRTPKRCLFFLGQSQPSWSVKTNRALEKKMLTKTPWVTIPSRCLWQRSWNSPLIRPSRLLANGERDGSLDIQDGELRSYTFRELKVINFWIQIAFVWTRFLMVFVLSCFCCFRGRWKITEHGGHG